MYFKNLSHYQIITYACRQQTYKLMIENSISLLFVLVHLLVNVNNVECNAMSKHDQAFWSPEGETFVFEFVSPLVR